MDNALFQVVFEKDKNYSQGHKGPMEEVMKKFLFLICVIGTLVFSFESHAELAPIMQQIGTGFKASFKAASKGDNSTANQEVVKNLAEQIALAVNILPPGISPGDVEVVARYQGLMNELLEKAVQLEDAFATNPMNKDSALVILKEMDTLRKKGHAIFR
jgi:hypothetical protein